MAKRDDKHSMAEDYLAQVEWQSHHSRRQKDIHGFKNQPDGKYKILYSKNTSAPLFIRIGLLLVFCIAIGFLLYQAIFLHSGKAIVTGIIFLSIGLIFFFAARAASSSKHRETDD